MKWSADLSSGSCQAGVTQLVECDLAKVDVAGSNPVSRSKFPIPSFLSARMPVHDGSMLLLDRLRQHADRRTSGQHRPRNEQRPPIPRSLTPFF
jgi:hypothetical protein